MSSRFMVGLGAWLLGTVTATTGSMIAVNELAQHLLDPQTLQLSSTAVDIDRSADQAHPAPAVSVSPTARIRRPAAKRKPRVAPSTAPSAPPATSSPSASSPPPPSSPSPPPSSSGTLLVSADGSVMATCESAGAYLVYWSPDTGFEADDVVRGPASVASVVFQNTANSLVMRVTCSGGQPVAHIGSDE